MRQLPPLAALRAFEAAARHLSFKRAAAELGVTPTAISHQVRLLEEVLALKLFDRGVREVALTPAGQQLFPALRDGFDTIAGALAALRKPGRRMLTLTALRTFAEYRLVPRIEAFREANPGLDLRLHASESVLDLTAGEADAAVRYGRGPFPGLVSEPLYTERFAPLCSPSLGLERPEQLADMPLLHSEWQRQGPHVPSWARWGEEAGLRGIDWRRGTVFTDESHAVQAAIAGKGVALLSPVMLAGEIARGLLVEPFGPNLPGLDFHFVHSGDPRRAGDMAALRAWLGDAIAAVRIP
ncbi:MAG: LysR family transcriptional regulator [Sphingomonas sp.]|nr:LysR family transcriptional regulator [Sphingomonas sp.]